MDAGEILAFMYKLLDNLASALSGPKLFYTDYQVGWQQFMHIMSQGMVLAGYMEEACIHARA